MGASPIRETPSSSTGFMSSYCLHNVHAVVQEQDADRPPVNLFLDKVTGALPGFCKRHTGECPAVPMGPLPFEQGELARLLRAVRPWCFYLG
jgi:hypothetical protein